MFGTKGKYHSSALILRTMMSCWCLKISPNQVVCNHSNAGGVRAKTECANSGFTCRTTSFSILGLYQSAFCLKLEQSLKLMEFSVGFVWKYSSVTMSARWEGANDLSNGRYLWTRLVTSRTIIDVQAF